MKTDMSALVLSATLLLTMLPAQAAQAADAADGPVRKSLQVQGLTMSYLQWGRDNAPPMILMPGAGSVSASWAGVGPGFAADYRVLSFDLPGQGHSDWDPARRYNVMTHVGYIKDAVRLLGLNGIVVVGHSQGGNEAVVYAAEDAERVVALVAADGGYMLPGSTRAARRAEAAASGAAAGASAPAAALPGPRSEFANWDEARASLPGAFTAEQRALLADNRYRQRADGRIVARNDPDKSAIAEADSMMQPGATAPFAQRVKVPAMVIRGGNDRAFARENADTLAELLPDVRLVVTVPGAGHSLPAEKPANFIAAVRGFLSLVRAAR